MDFKFNDEQLMMQKVCRDFIAKEVDPVVDEDDASHRFQRELVNKMG